MSPQLNGAHSHVNNKLKEKNTFVWKPVTVLKMNLYLFQNEITYIKSVLTVCV